MAALVWDASGSHFYETGLSNVALYVQDANGTYGNGVAWNGVTAINESPSGGELTDLWADDIKYASLRSAEEFGGSIEAYTYPDAFGECDGSASLVTGVIIKQQPRKRFGLAYKTKVGNDVSEDAGYIIHLIYGASANPSERNHQTINDSPEAVTFSWDFTTIPVEVTNAKPTSVIEIDSRNFTTTAAKAKLTAFEEKIWGGSNTTATLPLPATVKTDLTVSG